jgi:hypothetical protein
MSPTDGENLLTKIGPKNLQKDYAFSMCNLNLRQVFMNMFTYQKTVSNQIRNYCLDSASRAEQWAIN